MKAWYALFVENMFQFRIFAATLGSSSFQGLLRDLPHKFH